MCLNRNTLFKENFFILYVKFFIKTNTERESEPIIGYAGYRLHYIYCPYLVIELIIEGVQWSSMSDWPCCLHRVHIIIILK